MPGRAALAALAFLAGCAANPIGPGRASDRYEECASTAALRALERANALIAEGRERQALPLLREAVEACPDRVRTHLLYRRTARSVGDDAEQAMRRYYREELEDDASSPVPPYVRALLAADEASRRDLLQEALDRDPRFYYAHLSLGRMMRRLRRPERALPHLRRALAARPSFHEARIEIADTLAELGRYREAETHYENYLRARPTDRQAAEAFARLLIYDLGRPDRAEPLVERMLEEDPEDTDALMHEAAIAWKRERHEAAVALYHRVLELDPRKARAVLNLGNLYFEPLAQGADRDRRAAWAKARKAYLYFRNMQRTANVYDTLDLELAVPFRLEKIADLLGPDDGSPPRLEDF